MPDDSDFYIGYLPVAPQDTARLGRRLIVALIGGAAALGALIASRQPKADPSVFEYGVERSFEGQIVEHPYPALLVQRPGITDRAVAYSRYWLVAQGKHGAQETVRGLDGGSAQLKGSLIYRDGETMVEVTHAASHASASATAIQTTVLGRFTLHGEIVDSQVLSGRHAPGERRGPPRLCHPVPLRWRTPAAHRARLNRPRRVHPAHRRRRGVRCPRIGC